MASYREGRWSGNSQPIWTQGKQGESIEMEFAVPKSREYELIAVFTKAGDYGIFEIAVDGKTTGKPIDLYDPKVTTTGEISLGTVHLDKGTHVLKATAVGHNEKSRDTHAGNHIFGLDYLRLKRGTNNGKSNQFTLGHTDLAGLHDADSRHGTRFSSR